MSDKVVITCAVTGVLTDPNVHPVPVSIKEMAQACKEAHDAGASIVHLHFRDQRHGKGMHPSWDAEMVEQMCQEIKRLAPDLILNFSTGVLGEDISGPLSCLERVRPEMAALNAGTLNYLKTRADGSWAWRPMLFDNPVEKIESFLAVMNRLGIVAECECFDTGILRSIKMFESNGMLKRPYSVSLVMGVASGMPANPAWLELLMEEIPRNVAWQTIAIGRQLVWDVHRKTCELGGNLRTGLEDTFYLPDGQKAQSNGPLIEALVKIAKEVGREVATPAQARKILNL